MMNMLSHTVSEIKFLGHWPRTVKLPAKNHLVQCMCISTFAEV